MTIQEAIQRAVQLHSGGQFQQAEILCRQVLQVHPNQTAAISILGAQAMLGGNPAQAVELFSRAVQIDPSDAAHHSNLAQALHAVQRSDDAVEIARRAVAIAPNIAQYWYNLGVILQFTGHAQAALETYRKAVELDPNHAAALVNLSAAAQALDRLGEAVQSGQRAVALQPSVIAGHINLAAALAKQGRLDESLVSYRRAIELSPDNAGLHSQMLYTMLHGNFPMDQIYHEHLAWAARYAKPLSQNIPTHLNDRTPNRRLRIGYVSPYFVRHAVSFFVEPMLAAHDRSKFEIICYSDASHEDEVTAKLKTSADGWRTITPMDHPSVSKLIREDRIDILVDLSGHLPQNRLLSFAQRPVPIQVTYLGYQTTTGLSTMDYRLTDAVADPPGQTDHFHTEKLVRLPLFFVYQPMENSPPVGASPVSESGRITFGSFNNAVKIGPAVHEVWAKILQAIPESRLLFLIAGGEEGNEHIRRAYEQRGVESSRIELIPACPAREYLTLYNRIDISLDPFPFGGHTTTCDALWMGVPTIVLAGEHYVSRMGASVMHSIGKDEWVATSTSQYINKVIELARDHESLQRHRSQLRQQLQNSPAMDATRFTRSLEDAYQQMWKTWIG